MRIDLIIDGIDYSAEPYLGQTECLYCDLAKICDDIHTPPCSLYHSKVIFKEKNAHSLLQSIPPIDSQIQITQKRNGVSHFSVGEIVKVISVVVRKDEFVMNILKSDGKTTKSMLSRNFKWVVIA